MNLELVPLLFFIMCSGIIVYLIVLAFRKYILPWRRARHTKVQLPWKNIECFSLLRHDNNPILSPDAASYWQSEGTFNPAALMDSDGNVHVLYRTVGGDGVSRLGYMMSQNGMDDWERLAYPVYESDVLDYSRAGVDHNFDPGQNTSGGGWIGCEDPRLTIVGDTVYMLYVAFGGWDSIRIAYSTQSLSDFRMRRFNWSRSKYLSPPGQTNKNWVLFPEKINGKFALLYNIWPKISIHYVDRLDDLEYKSLTAGKSWNRGAFPGMPDSWILHEQGTAGERWVDPEQLDTNTWGNSERWDTWMRGVGPSPMKTELGWLVIYHAMDKTDPHRYKIGVMILDYSNPEKVLYKAPVPLLSPDEHYENDYKNGVLFACGAVIRDGTLLVYYGGGDKHVCVAQASMGDLLKWMKEYPIN